MHACGGGGWPKRHVAMLAFIAMAGLLTSVAGFRPSALPLRVDAGRLATQTVLVCARSAGWAQRTKNVAAARASSVRAYDQMSQGSMRELTPCTFVMLHKLVLGQSGLSFFEPAAHAADAEGVAANVRNDELARRQRGQQ